MSWVSTAKSCGQHSGCRAWGAEAARQKLGRASWALPEVQSLLQMCDQNAWQAFKQAITVKARLPRLPSDFSLAVDTLLIPLSWPLSAAALECSFLR